MSLPKFTIIGERHYRQIDWGGPLPPCQGHLIDRNRVECPKPGEFDSPTKDGPWADLCHEHVDLHAPPRTLSGYHRIERKV